MSTFITPTVTAPRAKPEEPKKEALTLSQFRERHPQYDDMSDDELATAIHRKSYTDMDPQEFNRQIGHFGIDYTGPAEEVRTKIAALPDEKARDIALRDWAGKRVKSERSEPTTMRTIGEGVRSVANGAGLGYADELGAAIQGGLYTISGGKVGEPYDERLAYERAYDNAVAKDQGVVVNTGLKIAGAAPLAVLGPAAGESIGADVLLGAGYGGVSGFGEGEGGFGNRLKSGGAGAAAGGVAGGVASGLLKGGNQVRRAYANSGERGAYGAFAESLPDGPEAFANQVASGATNQNATINRRTLDILGEEMQHAAGDVQAAQTATINRIATEAGVTPQTAAAQIRRLTEVHEGSPLLLGEYPGVAASDAARRGVRPGNVDLDEIGRVRSTQTQGLTDYLANNGNARSAVNTRDAVLERQESLAPTMRNSLEDLAPRVGPARGQRAADITDVENMQDVSRQAARQDYDAAYNGPINNAVSLHVLPRVLEAHRYRAAGRAGEPRQAIERALDQFYITTGNGQRLAMNTLQQLQDARGAVRGQMTEYTRGGRDDLVNAVQPIYRHITRLMEGMSPQWAQANRRWADLNFAEIAQDLGDAFSTKAGPLYREQVRQFQDLAPQAQDIVRVHFLQKLYDKLDNLPDTHSVSKMFSNDHSRSMIRQLFGDGATADFARAVRDQKAAEISQKALSGAATHRRGMAQAQMDTETGLVAAVENANARGVRNWLLQKAAQLLTERRNQPLADIVTTPLTDTAQVARHVHGVRQQADRLARIDQRGPVRQSAPALAGYAAGANVPDFEPDDPRNALYEVAR